jgi:hypothetical protein
LSSIGFQNWSDSAISGIGGTSAAPIGRRFQIKDDTERRKGKMGRGAALLGLVIVLGIGYYVYEHQLERNTTNETTPKQIIDTTGVQSDLLSIAQAERMYFANSGTYASLEQLENEGELTFSGANRRGFHYISEIQDGAHFKITATPADPGKLGWPTFSIDETMQITRSGVQ